MTYVFSAYALIIVCVKIFYFLGDVKENIKIFLERIPLLKKYMNDSSFKTHVLLYLSVGINILYAIIKFISGVIYHSFWFGTLAVYYFLLAVMRLLLLRHVSNNILGQNIILELKQYRICGIILGVMNIALTGVVVLMVKKNEGFEYGGYLIYVMAMYTFYSVINAIINVVKYRNSKSPIISASKVITFVSALVSILSLETAMLVQFNTEKGPAFRQLMIGITGSVVCFIVLLTAFYMVVNSIKAIRKYSIDGGIKND
ncbi:hypothetical protein [Thomasclavelia saccharogumia]|uniref:hypothetical protein n=1 Tax=Thomasclavelia saccharogumia TaxID=341225 RepID=UPI0011CC8A08|nr:hypothetical protein [Thomasclavelia saccharogumia]